MREELGSQLDIDNVHMESIITKVREKRKMRTNLTHFPIDDEIGAPRGLRGAITTLPPSHGITENPAIAKTKSAKIERNKVQRSSSR